ncbi:cytochrome P450 [Luminiphilus sp.]|nr:cytochrome P450 [Luminiphilus sp.]MDC1116713.1 cytochrome P450 [Luminiphilus sp.]
MSTPPVTIDLSSESFLREPHESYRLGRQHHPVYRVPDQNLIMVFGYDPLLEALMKPKVFSSKNTESVLGASIHNPECQEIYREGWPQVDTLLTNDPPSHTRFKKLVNQAFTKERVDGLQGHFEAMADKLIDGFIAKGQCGFIDEFANPLPSKVMAQQLGIQEKDIAKIKVWSDAFIDLIGTDMTSDEQIQRARLVVEFQHYMKGCLDERRIHPSQDLLTDLVNARVDEETPLNEAELLNVAQAILVAANTTTAHMLSGGLLRLIDNPEQCAKVQDNPELIPNMVEELLRLQTPTQGMWRTAAEDTELGGVAIKKGEMLLLLFTSANRDEKYFPNPDDFDVERNFSAAHVAFSRGVHTCIGMMLARQELVCAFRQILKRMDNITLADPSQRPRYEASLIFRGLETLDIAFTAR